MIELLAFGILAVGAVLGGIFLLLVLPFMLLAGLFRLLFAVVILPFKLAGAMFGMLGALFLGLFKVLGFMLSVVLGLLAVLAGLVFVPLIPLLVIGLFFYLLFRMSRSRPVAQV